MTLSKTHKIVYVNVQWTLSLLSIRWNIYCAVEFAGKKKSVLNQRQTNPSQASDSK